MLTWKKKNNEKKKSWKGRPIEKPKGMTLLKDKDQVTDQTQRKERPEH